MVSVKSTYPHGDLCKPGFAVAGTWPYIYILFGWNLLDKNPSREQPLNTRRRGRRGKWPPCLPSVFSDLHGALPPRYTPGWPSSSCGFRSLSPPLSVLLAFRSLEPLGRRGPLCSVLQKPMLYQTSKDYSDRLPVDPWCEWDVTSEKSLDLRADSASEKARVPWIWSGCQNIVLLQSFFIVKPFDAWILTLFFIKTRTLFLFH